MDDFAEKFHSPVPNFNMALRDTVESIMVGTTVRNLVCKIKPTMDWMKGSKDNKFSMSAANTHRGVVELLVNPISQGGTTVRNLVRKI